MANVFINNLSVPRKPRNKRIYAGNTFNATNPYESSSQNIKHFEHGKITDITDNSVLVYFASEFVNKPICINLKVYRMVENIPTAGKWIMQDVVHYFDDDEDWVVKTGFSLFIDDSEPLAGVIVEYCFTE